MNQKFYNCNDIFPELLQINKPEILNELHHNLQNNCEKLWLDWPESHLYKNKQIDGNWKIIPFFGFGVWASYYCKQFPHLTSFLKSLPNLKIAILSQLGPNTTLEPHYGWGKHSNNVIRCHYGIILPNDTKQLYISVQNNYDDVPEIQHHKLNDWIAFDDSKLHFAVNNSNDKRIVLIIDLDRPEFIKTGTSSSEETKELNDIIEQIKMANLLDIA